MVEARYVVFEVLFMQALSAASKVQRKGGLSTAR
jgi:hypothetical protein